VSAFRRPIGPRPGNGQVRSGLAVLGVAALAVVAGLATARSPTLAVATAATASVALIAITVGPEACIGLAGLASFGLLPFLSADRYVGGQPLWVVGFVAAAALMLATWAAREIVGEPSHRLQRSPLLALVLALFAYTLLRLAAGTPLAIPTLSLPFVLFPAAALVCALWLSHPAAIAGLRRALPILAGIVGLWAIAHVFAATGHCSACLRVVSSTSERPGLLGPASRIYSSGQGALLALTLVATASAFARPRRLTVVASLVGLTVIVLQSSRAQYGGVLAAIALLLAWRIRWSTPGRRVAIVALSAVAFAFLISSPVGERGLTAVSDLKAKSGNVGYRFGLLDVQRQHWSVFGTSVSAATVNAGIDYDLGIPNTIVVLGWVGAALQVAVLLFGILRGLRARTAAGAAVAAVCLAVLTTRVSLPFIESGESAAVYGLIVGFALALYTPEPRLT
jgi:hypothetical protein